MPEIRLQGHMLGIKIFVEAQSFKMSGGLGEAAFWVGLRQEIYSAMMNHESIALPLENCLVDRSVGPVDDFGWANRAVVHCADVLNCCFGPSGHSKFSIASSAALFQFLTTYLQLLEFNTTNLQRSCWQSLIRGFQKLEVAATKLLK